MRRRNFLLSRQNWERVIRRLDCESYLDNDLERKILLILRQEPKEPFPTLENELDGTISYLTQICKRNDFECLITYSKPMRSPYRTKEGYSDQNRE